MLSELRIRNLAVIEDVTVPFGSGFTVLTGETGAGKSIVIDALLLVVGARAQPDLIRTTADAALIEASFELAPDSPVAAILEGAGHGLQDGQLVIKRELARSGRHRVFVNDAPATVGLLERLGEVLVELHGQHEHQRLMEPARQLLLLDRFADCEARRERVEDLAGRWERARRELAKLAQEGREQARQEETDRFQLSEIDAGRPREGEEDELRSERRRLQHGERIAAGLHEVLALLYEDGQSASARLRRAGALLRDLSAFDPELAAPTEALGEAEAYLADAVARARALRDRTDFDPARMEEIDERLDALARLRRKYGETVEAVLAYREEVAGRLQRLARHEDLVAEAEARLQSLGQEAASEALALSGARTEAAARLGRLIQKELRGLGMEHARFAAVVGHEPAQPGELACGAGRWRVDSRGADAVEFLLSANPGEELKPLAKVVSGGELSRTMLAIKTVLAAADRMPTMVFDEVDAGIGGRVADVVGQKLRATASGRQVLCVSHLATIAAHADHHLVVEKRVLRGTTRTTVAAPDAAGRVEELARMLGGERITEATRRHARELVREARRQG
ncbi:MAG: DNA repair protein RecN [Candidatus Rokubacteria bacterium]|nr:DNA repair protein RecN [Candidatus Rokubacteria bacterium]